LSQAYAAGKKAFGFCDRCGFRYPLIDLKDEVVDLEKTGLLTCEECWDPDHPQNALGRWPVDDPQALRNPRPDSGQTESRWGGSTVWNFTQSVEDWRYVKPSGSDNTISWNESDGTVTATQTVSGIGSLEYYKKADLTGSYASIDLAAALADERALDTVRVVIRLDDSTASDMGTWVGKFYWDVVDDPAVAPFAGDYNVSVSEPDWDESMGDRYVTLEFDPSVNANWAGTITSLRFDLYNTSSNFKAFRIDSIRVEEN
jgi:hypothetical protein